MTVSEMSGGGAERAPLPPMVYIPTENADLEASETVVEMRQAPDGRTVLPTYSALDRLVDACGDAQPWMLLPADRLEELREAVGFDDVLIDVPLPPEQRRMQSTPDGNGRSTPGHGA